MLVYPHPLDYATGIKYSVVDKSLGVEYTVSPDSFIVEEIVDFEKRDLTMREESTLYSVF